MILFHRQIKERIKLLAPFLSFDKDPYLVLADGKLYWMIDAYTTSKYFPYSQPFSATENIQYKEGGATKNYVIDEFYDPKIKARDGVEDQIIRFKETNAFNGFPVTNLKIGDIQEVPGGFLSEITYTDKDNVNIKYLSSFCTNTFMFFVFS